MFTKEQIHNAFKKVKGGADFPQFVNDLKSIGVRYYDNYVVDGTTQYFDANNRTLEGDSKYPHIQINDVGSADLLKHAINIHQQGETDYLTFCRQAAAAGVEKWTTHVVERTVTYFDKEGNRLIVEPIPNP